MKVLDLFSGIGGFSLGLDRAGFETVAFCEIEKYPRSILKKHWPDVPIAKDIRKLSYCWETKKLKYDGELIYVGTIDLISAGFPCQPFSVAGQRGGKEDDRYLWPEALRLIKETKCRWFVGENVSGIVSMAFEILSSKLESKTIARHNDNDYFNNVLTRQETMCLEKICESLEEICYEVQPIIIPACAVGAVHRRYRVWIVANASGERLQREPVAGCNEKIGAKSNDKQFIRCSSSQPFRPIEPPTQCPVRHRNDGLSDNVARLKALGNAVVPQIPELIGRAIMEIENNGK